MDGWEPEIKNGFLVWTERFDEYALDQLGVLVAGLEFAAAPGLAT